MSVGVVIVAGGRGERMGSATPKSFLDVGGRSMLQRSVTAFDRHPAVGELVVVLPADWLSSAAEVVGATDRPCRCVAGGYERHDSVRAGYAALSNEVDVILIHDAARPFADAALIDRVLEATRETGAALPALATRDTVKRVQGGGRFVAETLPRNNIWLAQTPQGFRRDILAAAMTGDHAEGAQGPQGATDEAMLVERAGHPVRVVDGDEGNIKVTTPGDLAVARARFASAPRVGTGYDLHRLVEGRPLVFAGVVVPFTHGPFGHSDGDVVCHALVDAMLSAAGAGDIGQHFPDTDGRWKGAAGPDLLARAVAIVRERGFAVASADITVVLERPKLAPHLPAIRRALADVIGIAVDGVGVKGKTNEGVDAVGRGEAIAAHAVAVLIAERRS